MLGLPRNMDGSEGPRAQSTRAFARNLAGLTELPIAFWDERLSTVAAERALLEADTSRRRRAEVIDQVAAGYILQGFLDRLGHLERSRDDRRGLAPRGGRESLRQGLRAASRAGLCIGCYRSAEEIAALVDDDPGGPPRGHGRAARPRPAGPHPPRRPRRPPRRE